MNFRGFYISRSSSGLERKVTKVRSAREQNWSNWKTWHTVGSDNLDEDEDDEEDEYEEDGDEEEEELMSIEFFFKCECWRLASQEYLIISNFQFTIFDGGEPTKSRSLLQDRQDHI